MKPTKKFADYMSSAQRAKANVEISLEMDQALLKLKERSKRNMLRKIEAGQVTWDKAKKVFIWAENEADLDLDKF